MRIVGRENFISGSGGGDIVFGPINRLLPEVRQVHDHLRYGTHRGYITFISGTKDLASRNKVP